jgi:uncharacterized membrane protein YphA (DoxX/SURF4 family)
MMLLLGLGALGIYNVSRLERSVDSYLMAPRNSPTLETANRVGRSFCPGQTGQYNLLLIPRGSPTVYTEDFWGNATQLLEDVVEAFGNESRAQSKVQSVLLQYNHQGRARTLRVPMALARLLDPGVHNPGACALIPEFLPLKKECEEFEREKSCLFFEPLANMTQRLLGLPGKEIIDMCSLLQVDFAQTVAPKRDAVIATLMPSQQVGSKESVDWVTGVRELLSSGRYPALEGHLDGLNAQVYDAIDSVYDRTPLVLAITMVCCLVFIGLLTTSLAFALSSVLLIAWTMVVVYGFGVAVYQESLMGPGAPQQLKNTGGLAWLVLPLTFTVVLGLGLDYDIFLLGRVCEYHCQGYSDREAIANGVARTGPVITSAGIIMAIAFGGLILSDVPLLNQMALLLVLAVLIDTFFIRSLATPAVHAPLGRINWWPRKASRAPQAAAPDAGEAGMAAQLCPQAESS